MSDRTQEIKQAFLNELSSITDIASLENVKVKYLGKNGKITALMKDMRALAPEEKKVFGQVVNKLKGEASSFISAKF